MITTFSMPTRIVAGQGSLATIGTRARELTMTRVLPHKVGPLAEALAVEARGLGRAETIAACAEAVRALYADIDFPTRFTPAQLPAARVREMAERAVPGLYAGIAAQDFDPRTARDETVIACPSARKMTVRQAEAMLARCLA